SSCAPVPSVIKGKLELSTGARTVRAPARRSAAQGTGEGRAARRRAREERSARRAHLERDQAARRPRCRAGGRAARNAPRLEAAATYDTAIRRPACHAVHAHPFLGYRSAGRTPSPETYSVAWSTAAAGPELGSGTSIRIGDRLFIATAAHVLEDIAPANLRV